MPTAHLRGKNAEPNVVGGSSERNPKIDSWTAQFDRAMHQPAQAVPPHRHSLRENRHGLSFNAIHWSDNGLGAGAAVVTCTANDAETQQPV
jgi:hypothetical protein